MERILQRTSRGRAVVPVRVLDEMEFDQGEVINVFKNSRMEGKLLLYSENERPPNTCKKVGQSKVDRYGNITLSGGPLKEVVRSKNEPLRVKTDKARNRVIVCPV